MIMEVWFLKFLMILKYDEISNTTRLIMKDKTWFILEKWHLKMSIKCWPRGTFNPPAIASLMETGSCWIVLAAWLRAPRSCSGIDSSLTFGDSNIPSMYSSFIRRGPSTDSLVVTINLLSICISTEEGYLLDTSFVAIFTHTHTRRVIFCYSAFP